MIEAINKVKAAIAPKDIASHLSHYLVRDNMLFASDNRMTAATPFPLAGEFLVPGGEFEAMASRFGEKTKVVINPNNVIFTDGKMKATLKTLPLDIVDYQRPKGKPEVLPPDFLLALRSVLPFISDNAVHYWALAACLGDGYVYATNNVVVVASECKGLKGGGRLLPCWAIEYLLSRSNDEMTGAIYEVNSITFVWADRSWMTALLVDGQYPQQAIDLMEKLAKPTFHLSPEWKTSYEAIAEMSDALVEFHPERMVGLTPKGEIEVAMKTPSPKGAECSKWNTKFLTPVVAAADYWQPDTWPKPSPFVGEGIRGLIVGRN